jgi:hypothetical protein
LRPDPSNYGYLVSIEEKCGDKNNEIPVVVVGEYILVGVDEVGNYLEPRIVEYKDSGCDFPEIGVQRTSPLGSGRE